MSFRLDDETFPVKKSSLWASINDPYWCDTFNGGNEKSLQWGIDVHGDHRVDAGSHRPPHAYHHTMEFEIRRWRELEGEMLEWFDPYDDETDLYNGGFYVQAHGSILEAKLQLHSFEGASIGVTWDGLCERLWDLTDESPAEFSIDTKVVFKEVLVRGNENDPDGAFRDRLSQFLDPDDFEQQEVHRGSHRYQDGVGMVDCRFTPIVG